MYIYIYIYYKLLALGEVLDMGLRRKPVQCYLECRKE